jgi:IclR family pca regulon transcriptional regulator
MEELSERTNESCSAGHPRPARRRLRGAHADAADHDHLAGRRLAAAGHCTSIGRVLLAGLPDDELDAFLAGAELEAFTEHTITDRARLRAAIDTVRAEGWALVDQELEIGLRSISAPLRVGGRRSPPSTSRRPPLACRSTSCAA